MCILFLSLFVCLCMYEYKCFAFYFSQSLPLCALRFIAFLELKVFKVKYVSRYTFGRYMHKLFNLFQRIA